ncbi:hypothetical protein [Ornithinibacillus xuwenensis]|uniref:Phage tail protein n=1 Tax=Ornithinibacillus xuwenensis TaxID=3144668 RepID=A0ABU9XBZ8_9BACI
MIPIGQMDIGGTATQTMQIAKFDGVNTALAFSELKNTEALKVMNGLPGSLGSLAKRPGTIPVTASALATPITGIFSYRKTKQDHVMAVSNNQLFELTGDTLTAKTGTLSSSEVDQAQFKDENGQEVLIIADGGNLKYYDGTDVKEIVPAADDADPLPKNDLNDINANHKPIGCLVHGARVVVWDGSDTIWHSKVGYYDYFPQTDFIRFVRKGDYIQTCVTYRGALLVFLRNSLAVLFGQDIENWQQDFLSTEEGCINPKTVQQVTFPDGKQEIFYLSDNGIQAVYTIDTVLIDSQARYSTRSVSRTQIDWKELGVTKEEWQRAVAHFYDDKYWLIYPKGDKWEGLVFDTVFSNWYFINNIDAHAFFDNSDMFLFASDSGHVKEIDDSLFSDWDDKNRTTGTPINMYWYSNLLTPAVTGFDHFWDVVIVEAKQQFHKSTVDLELNTYDSKMILNGQLKTEMMVWGDTVWGQTQWPSINLTHYVNYAKRIRFFQKGKYLQIKISNNRDEPIEIYNITLEVRAMRPY